MFLTTVIESKGKSDAMKSKPHKNNNGSAKSSQELGLREQIEKRAHEIWLAAGCCHGDDVYHWLLAEREVLKARGERSEGKRRSITVHEV